MHLDERRMSHRALVISSRKARDVRRLMYWPSTEAIIGNLVLLILLILLTVAYMSREKLPETSV